MALRALVSDTQFDNQPSYATIGPDGTSSRLRDAIACFEWVVKTAIDRGCETLIHAGDVFESRTSIDVDVLDAVGRAFQRASERLEVWIIPGNHDSALRSPRIHSLRVLVGLAQVIDGPFAIGKFAFVPWIEDDAEFEKAVATVAGLRTAEYLVAHCMVEGAVPNVSGARPLSMLMPQRWRQVFLGDVHEPVQVAKNVRYCGSPMQWHYGDAGRKRGFLVVDDVTGHVEFVENTISPRFHSLEEVAPNTVRDDDYVRIKTDDIEVAREIAKTIAKKRLRRIDSNVVELPDAKPRLDVHVSDDRRKILTGYFDHVGMGDVPDLVDIAVECLDEAEHGG